MPRILPTHSTLVDQPETLAAIYQQWDEHFVLPTQLWEMFIAHPGHAAIKQPVSFLREAFEWLTKTTRDRQAGDFIEIPSRSFPAQWDGYKRQFWKLWLNDTGILTEDRRPGRPRYIPAHISKTGKGQCCRYMYQPMDLDDSLTVLWIERPRRKPAIEIRHDMDISARMLESLRLTEIDLLGAIRAESKQHEGVKLASRLNRCLAVASDKLYVGMGQNSCRVHHTFSNLSKISREHLHVAGIKFNEADVVNCQPLLLVSLIKKNGLPIDQAFIDAVESGNLYELFVGVKGNFLNWNGKFESITREEREIVDRKQAKIEFFNSVLFDWKGHSPLNQRFQELFPLTTTACKRLHRSTVTLACALQCLESEIFKNIVPEIGHYWTLFDSIFFTEADCSDDIKDQIEQAFAQFDLKAEVTVTFR